MNEDLVRKIEDRTRIRRETDSHVPDAMHILPSGNRPCDAQSQVRRQTVEPKSDSGLAFLLCICGVLKTADCRDSKYSFKHPAAEFWRRLWRRVSGTG
jgi:hypothetical protein